MLTRFRISIALGLLVAAPAAFGHDTLPVYTWCAHGRAVQVAHFFFTPPEIEQFANCQSATACVLPDPASQGPGTGIGFAGRGTGPQPPDCTQILNPEPTTSCGIFDDDYALARRMTDEFCARYTYRSTGQHVADWGSVVPHVSSLEGIFYDPDFHHRYAIGSGIDAVCVRCEDPPSVPTN
ncbi:MAG: hypothetical protein ABI411_16180 [Tahibacter sp.]